MSNRLSGCVIAVAAVVAVVSLTSVPTAGPAPLFGLVGVAEASGAGAQAPQAQAGCPNEPVQFHPCAMARAKTFDPPRTPDGKPDMQGFWRGLGSTGNIEEHPKSADDDAGPTLIVDPPDGRIPYQPWAAAQIQENVKKYVEPNGACFPSGAVRSVYTPGGFEIRQSPGYVVILLDRAHLYRIIPTDGRPHIGENILLWQGDSRGRWEGNTLVVDTTNENGKSWLDQQGRFNTDAVHTVERFTPMDADTIHYQATIDDPAVYTRSWTMVFPIRRNKQKQYEFLEFACYEGEHNADIMINLGYRIYPGVRLRSPR